MINHRPTAESSTLSLHDALPIWIARVKGPTPASAPAAGTGGRRAPRSEEHTSELQSHSEFVCRLVLEKQINRIDHGPAGGIDGHIDADAAANPSLCGRLVHVDRV